MPASAASITEEADLVLTTSARGVHLCALKEVRPDTSEQLYAVVQPPRLARCFQAACGTRVTRAEQDIFFGRAEQQQGDHDEHGDASAAKLGGRGGDAAALVAAYAVDESALRDAVGLPALDVRRKALASLVFRINRSCQSKIFVAGTFEAGTEELLRAVREGDLMADTRFCGGQSLLQLAAGKIGSTELAVELLGQAATAECINGRDAQGMTALARAVCNGHKDIAERLLAAGASPNIPDHEEGLTPFGYSLRGVNLGASVYPDPVELQARVEVHAALESSFVPWSAIEALLDDKRLASDIHSLCDRLCDLGFADEGDSSSSRPGAPRRSSAAVPIVLANHDADDEDADALDGRGKQAFVDRLQLANQWMGVLAGTRTSSMHAEARARARRLADAVVLPLLRLAGRKQLQGRNKRFARYALESGVLAAAEEDSGNAGNAAAMAAVDESLALLESELAACYVNGGVGGGGGGESLADVAPMEHLLADRLPHGRVLHQRAVHGPLPWLERLDADATARALLDAGMPAAELMKRISALPSVFGGCDLLTLRHFLGRAYVWWLQLVAARCDEQLRPWLRECFGAALHLAPLKTETRVRAKQHEYRDVAQSISPLPPITQVRPWAAGETIANDNTNVPSLGHVLEAGGMCDLCRFSIVCAGTRELRLALGTLRGLRLDRGDAAEVVRVKNGFHPDSQTVGGYRDVKVNLRVAVKMPGGHVVQHIAEAQLLLQSYADIKTHMHLLYKVQRGDYFGGKFQRR